MKTLGISLFCAATMWAMSPAHAKLPADAQIRGAKLCTQHFAHEEARHGIPSQLLAAISNTESGRWNDKLGMVLPWPWTINAEGKGYYFDSKAEAILKVKALQAKGMKSIDIGCMQVNLKHHPKAFANLDQAFEPRYNVAYAASYLRQHYDDMHSWQKAIGAYHSKTPKYGNKYRARVQKAWDVVTGKVRTARSALASLARRPDSPSYRVISISGDNKNHNVKTIRPVRSSFSLAMRDAEPTAAKGIALRPQDRLSSLPNVAVPRPAGRNTTLIRGKVKNARLSSQQQAASSDDFVSVHGQPAAKSTRQAPKPKFIFVE